MYPLHLCINFHRRTTLWLMPIHLSTDQVQPFSTEAASTPGNACGGGQVDCDRTEPKVVSSGGPGVF